MSSETLNRAKQRGLEEGKRFFWIFLYLWALLGCSLFTTRWC